MAVSKRLRYEILKRDNHTCRYCGATAPNVPLRVDHVTPVALGGSDDPTNLVTACEPCNSGKTSSTPDAAVVADVASDALRWAAAMKQAAEQLREQQRPKLAYRQTFLDAWNGWTYDRKGEKKTFDLPNGWKTSLETFHQAGLAADVWPDIVEKAMTNKTVRADNLFRYCCGIAWRMVRELQDTAKGIVSKPSSDNSDVSREAKLVAETAMALWASERGDDREGEAEFRATVVEACRDAIAPAHRIIEAARQAAWYTETSIRGALATLDRSEVLLKWEFAWFVRAGDFPSKERTEIVRDQYDKLLEGGVPVGQIARAAEYAGAHRSAQLYFGLSDNKLALTKMSDYVAKVGEIWSSAFEASANRWPTDEEKAALFGSLRRIGADGEFAVADVYAAAAAAGSYQDHDLSTCLTRHLSVFEIAAQPLGGNA